MLRVLGCVVDMHDLRLVFLAALVCVFACYTAVNLKTRAHRGIGQARYLWLAAAAFVTGSGVWATHFVAELAFRPGLPIAYDLNITILSVVIAVLVSSLGLWIALGSHRYAASIGGAIVGVGVAAMHYTGMMALKLPAVAQWDMSYVIASLIVSIGVSSIAFIAARRRTDLLGRVRAAGLLVLAIVSLHFTGMTAVTFLPDPTVIIPDQALEPEYLAIAIAAVTMLIVGIGLTGSIVDQHLAERSSQEAARLREYVAALEVTKNDLSKALGSKPNFSRR
jgi:NO-binding membrane sensor protein with MHYT domain